MIHFCIYLMNAIALGNAFLMENGAQISTKMDTGTAQRFGVPKRLYTILIPQLTHGLGKVNC